jgi:hypothetical protein
MTDERQFMRSKQFLPKWTSKHGSFFVCFFKAQEFILFIDMNQLLRLLEASIFPISESMLFQSSDRRFICRGNAERMALGSSAMACRIGARASVGMSGKKDAPISRNWSPQTIFKNRKH